MTREAEPRWVIFRHPIVRALVATDRDPGRPPGPEGWLRFLVAQVPPIHPNCRCQEIRKVVGRIGLEALAEGKPGLLAQARGRRRQRPKRRNWKWHDP